MPFVKPPPEFKAKIKEVCDRLNQRLVPYFEFKYYEQINVRFPEDPNAVTKEVAVLNNNKLIVALGWNPLLRTKFGPEVAAADLDYGWRHMDFDKPDFEEPV
jgi:hypothetical protein